VLIAGFVSSYRFYEAVLPALAEVVSCGSLIAHAIAETYSVLSTPGGIYRHDRARLLTISTSFWERTRRSRSCPLLPPGLSMQAKL